MKSVPVLTDQEIEVLRRGRSDPNIITDYFFRPYGAAKGFRFDDNFVPIGAWQMQFVQMQQKNAIISGGFGTGKSLTAGMGAAWLSLIVHPDFKFLNVAPTALQSQWMYEMILKQAAGAPFERLIWSSPAKPYPKIEIKFKVYNTIVSSTLFFMSVDKNARNILTFEGDWINIDEAALIPDLQDVVISLRSRLRGSFRGRERMGRLTMISNPWPNDYFWYLFDLAQADPESYLSMTVSTRHNKNVTMDQLKEILASIPPSEHDRYIDGARPEGEGNFFSRQAIYDCEDEEWGDVIEKLAAEGHPGYAHHRLPGAGTNYYTTPRKPNPPMDDVDSPTPIYIILGDPGTDSAPARNAPTIGVFEVTDFPFSRAELVALWWGDGAGSIAPFVVQLARLTEQYDPMLVAVDSTATQKNFAETLNALISQKDEEGYSTLFGQKFTFKPGFKVKGLDFSGAKKSAYLVALQFVLESRLLRWPKNVAGLRGQLSNYDPENDKSQSTSKFPQDLVAMMSMAAYVMRRWFNNDPQNDAKTCSESAVEDNSQIAGRLRYDRHARTRRTRQQVAVIEDEEEFAPVVTAPAPSRRIRKAIRNR